MVKKRKKSSSKKKVVKKSSVKKKKQSKKSVGKSSVKGRVVKKKVVKKSVSSRKLKSFKRKKVTQKQERLSTGTRNFDKLIEGGFVNDSNNLLVGGSGSGKTIFGVQFLVEGIKSNEKCLYISFEERRENFFRNMLNVNIDLEAYEKKGNFHFLEYTPQKVKAMLDEGGGAIETLVLTKGITRIVIDSISSFTLLFEKELEKKEAALSLFTLLRSWDCTTLLISDEDARDETESSKIIDEEVDSIIKFYFQRGQTKRTRFLEIMKMRGTNHSLNVHSFKIDDKGLSIGPKIRRAIKRR